MSQRSGRQLRSITTGILIAAIIVIGAISGPITFLASGHDAGLEVSIDETNSPIAEGERLEVTVTVSNNGDDLHSDEITLTVGGIVRDSEDVTLDGGQTKTITLSWVTETGDDGDYEATVASDTDTNSTSVTVEEAGPWFTVDIDETNSPIAEGETLRVTATIQNIESRSWNQTVDLTVGGEVRDTKNVSLDGGETTTVTFTWTTAEGDVGNYTASVATNQETARTAVRVQDAANISLTSVETNSPIVEGDTLSVTAVLENTGGVSGNETVSLDVAGFQNATTVSLAAGETERVTLSWATEPGDVGTYVATLTAGESTVQTAVAVLAPQNFTVTSLETNAPVEVGDELEVTAVIENVGDLPGNQTVTLSVGGAVRDATTVELGQDETTTVTLTWQTGSGDAGSYTAVVATANESSTLDLSIEEPPPDTTEANAPPTAGIRYEVDGSTPATVPAGSSVVFEAEASDPDGSIESYEWVVDGEVVSESAEFEYTFSEPGAHEVTLRVTDDDGATMTTSRTVEVGEPMTTEQTTDAPTQTTAYGPGLGVLTALIAIALLLLGLRYRADG